MNYIYCHVMSVSIQFCLHLFLTVGIVKDHLNMLCSFHLKQTEQQFVVFPSIDHRDIAVGWENSLVHCFPPSHSITHHRF